MPWAGCLHHRHFIVFSLWPPKAFLPAPLRQHVTCGLHTLEWDASPQTPSLPLLPPWSQLLPRFRDRGPWYLENEGLELRVATSS